jgi:hypothetical protein
MGAVNGEQFGLISHNTTYQHKCTENDSIAVWLAFESQPELPELTSFAKLLFKVVVNQVGCEWVFSDLKVKQTQCCNHLGLNKLAKMTEVNVNSMAWTVVTHTSSFCQIGSDIKAKHQSLGLAKSWGKLKVYTSTNTLLAVPCYSDFLDDQDHEDEAEQGQMLISNSQNWCTEMAK